MPPEDGRMINVL